MYTYYLRDNDGAISQRHIAGKANSVIPLARLILLRRQVILEEGFFGTYSGYHLGIFGYHVLDRVTKLINRLVF